MKILTVSTSGRTLTRVWPLLLGLLFFVWPVVMGIPTVPTRLLWIAVTLGLISLSTWQLARTLSSDITYTFRISLPSLVILIGLTATIALYAIHIPPLAFSDEITISVAGRTALLNLAHAISWPFLLAGSALIAIGTYIIIPRLQWKHALIGLLLFAGVAVYVALNTSTSGIAVRYPPVVHLIQIMSGILTGGSSALFRFPNALWTLLLGFIVWNMTPNWKVSARWGILAGVLLGPLAWTYRTALFQACGELTFAALCTFLLVRILHAEETKKHGALLGITLSLWFLYRPTAIAAIAAIIGLLLVLRRWNDTRVIASISFPVVAAWLILSPLYTAQYGFFPTETAQESALPTSIWFPIEQAIRALPHNFDTIGLAVLLTSSILIVLFGKKEQWYLLGAAWLIASSTAAMQHLLAGPVFYGVARYNILFLLPQGIAIGSLLAGTRLYARTLQLIGLGCIVALAATTPWKFVDYTQELRANAEDIYRTPTEGYLAFPVQNVVADLLPSTKDTMVIIAPHYTFLEALVVKGSLSIAERTAIIERSNAWTTGSPERPVIIQAPRETRYTPNLSQEQEQHLRDIRTWALGQEHDTVQLGIEETIIVR